MKRRVEVFALKSPTLPPATTTNCLFLGDKDFAIVDPASPWQGEQVRLTEKIKSRASEGFAASSILLTHHHHDHVGGVNALREALDLKVVAHPRTAELLAGQVEVDAFLEEGDVFSTGLDSWTVMHTPGHATGHLCFVHTETREAVVGDMVAGEGTIVLDPPEGDLASYLESLQRLKDVFPSVMYPAHGPALEDPQSILQHYMDHRRFRTDQIRSLIQGRDKVEPGDLVELIYSDIPRHFWPIAKRQILCHLRYLVGQCELREETEAVFTGAKNAAG